MLSLNKAEMWRDDLNHYQMMTFKCYHVVCHIAQTKNTWITFKVKKHSPREVL